MKVFLDYCVVIAAIFSLITMPALQFKIKNIGIMSVLYFWGKPITNGLFMQENKNIASISLEKVVEQVSCGEKHCVMVVDGEGYGFGDNSQGQLGQSEGGSLQEIVPISLGSLSKVKEVSCGWNHTLILDFEGIVYSSGNGEYGELGRGKNSNNFAFSRVLHGARQISAGKDHSLALCGSKVMGWGNSRDGQLGLLIKKSYFYPHELNVYPCDCIFAGPKYSIFVTSKGVFGSGMNRNCQLGLGHETDAQVPRRLAIQEKIISITGGNYVVAQTAEEKWYLWGTGGFGVFKFPTKMSFLEKSSVVAIGLNSGLHLKNGKAFVWGSNMWGELAIGSQYKQYATEALSISKLSLDYMAFGTHFVVGFSTKHSEDEQQVENASNEEEYSSITKQLFKNFKHSSQGSNRKQQKSNEDKWQNFYEIRHHYNITEPNMNNSFKEKDRGHHQENLKTWNNEQQPKRRVKLSDSLKYFTQSNWNHLEKQNQLLKERIQHEKLERAKMSQKCLSLLQREHPNHIYERISKLEQSLKSKKSTKNCEQQRINNFSSKLNNLKDLLSSAYQ